VRGFDNEVSLLWKRHRDDLFRYVARYSGDRDLAEDVVQETYLRLRDHPPPDDSRLKGWLFTVATNLARDALKLGRRRRQLEAEHAHELPRPTATANPLAQAELEDLRHRVRRALDSLSDKERMVLLMYQEGFRHREIGAAVGAATESVGSIIVRAARKVALVVGRESAS
jgi:RNA polymerase sigma-70 factor (ECF subfamily)